MVADRLKKSLAEVMELTSLELSMWAAYIKMEQDDQKRTMRKAKAKHGPGKYRP